MKEKLVQFISPPGLALTETHIATAGRAVLGTDARPDSQADPEVEMWTRLSDVAVEPPHIGDGWAELAEIQHLAAVNGEVEQAACVLATQACLATFLHDPARAVPLLDAAIEYFTVRGMPAIERGLRACRPYAYLGGGQWDTAESEARSVLADPRSPASFRTVPLRVLGLLRARQGRHWPVADDVPPETLAELAWLAGDDSRAIAEAQRGMARPALGPFRTGALGCWLRRAGGQVPDVPVAPLFVAELVGDWAAAAAGYERRGLPYEAAVARLRGDVTAVRQALDTFISFGAEPAARRARGRLRELGARRGTRPSRKATQANAFGLTSRQLEIAGLLVEGLTNGQIAARLVISHNTVNHHVAAILAKLHVHSRHEAARRFAGQCHTWTRRSSPEPSALVVRLVT